MIKQSTDQTNDPRFDIDTRGRAQFKQVLDIIDDDKDDFVLFPRPAKSLEPVNSYGVILFHEDDKHIYYCMCQRRTTVEFSEFVKCGPRRHKLFEYFSNMTPHERTLLVEKDHDALWDSLCLDEKHMFDETRIVVRERFETYSEFLPDLIELTVSVNEEPPYEFPKGRFNANLDKTLLSAAIRELREEANIELGPEIDLVESIHAVEEYSGTDDNLYQTDYYVIRCEELIEPEPIYFDPDENCIEEFCISNDMHLVAWQPLPKFGLVRRGMTPLHPRLESLLYRIHDTLRNISTSKH